MVQASDMIKADHADIFEEGAFKNIRSFTSRL
jgi:hypothetical protein